jgi:hypothetical protein
MSDHFNPEFEYRTTFTSVPMDFPNSDTIAEQLAKISPKPPKNADDWQLVTSTTVVTQKGPIVLFFWERPNRGPL